MGIKTKKAKSKDKSEKLKKKSKEGRVDREKKSKKKRAKEQVEITPIKEKLNRTQLLDHLVDETAVDKKSVKKVLTALMATMQGSIVYKKGSGEFTFPGLFKIMTKYKPAQKGGEKKKNPFKPGEYIITKPKPASVRVKIRPMKKLKEAAMPRSKD